MVEEVKTGGNHNVRLTLEFPEETNNRESERFEQMLKEIYLNKIQTGYVQMRKRALPLPAQEEKEG